MAQEEVALNAQPRKNTAKGMTHQLRREGKLPGVLYGGKDPVLPIVIDQKEFLKALHTEHGENVIISLYVSGSKTGVSRKSEKPVSVIIKEIQVNPVTRNLLHVDLYRISLKEEIQVNVPIEIYGEAPGVEKSGGVLDHVVHEIAVKCLPTKIPDKIICDVSSLEAGETLTVKDLEIPQGIEVLDDPEKIVVSIIAPTVVEEKPVEEEVAPEEVAEPEVIGKGKKEEEEEKEEKEEKEEEKEKGKGKEKKKEKKGEEGAKQ
ncbi:50S ribosomal protein L25 [bacterium]|nr:50S ribosomal protein L25 [bacterium]NIN92839.1 50S ribosomal protein L25 [bacterium]NIO18794.1 50S ribosomal protein L25 [bacterium]NIO73875.1 50S ribosomal protein L25 [bacterium]